MRHADNRFFAGLLPSFGLLYGYIFMWSNNSHMFSLSSLAVSFVVLLCLAVFIFLLNYFLVYKLVQIFRNERWRKILFAAITACLFVFFAWSIIHYFTLYNKNKIYSPILAIIFFFLIYKNKAKFIAIALSLMLVFSSFVLIKNLDFTQPVHPQSNINALTQAKFVKKPNIYLFWLESYHGLNILENIYGVKDSKFQDFIENNKFNIKESVYSSGPHTLYSMTQLFSCGKIEQLESIGNLDAGLYVRLLLSGNSDNLVLYTLKNNGYFTIFLTGGSDYYTYEKDTFLDDTDASQYIFNIHPLIAVNHYSQRLYSFLNNILPRVSSNKATSSYEGNLHTRVKHAMEKGRQSGKPYFISFKGGAFHTPTENYDYTMAGSWISDGNYQRATLNANREVEEIITHILHNDPSSLIVLLGDHGAWRFRGLPIFECNSNELFAACSENNIDVAEYFDDIYNILLAYRMPDGENIDISNGLYMNNINIFVHIFAYLAQDASLLKYRKKSISRICDVALVEGKLQQ